jgi:hypothetical protein
VPRRAALSRFRSRGASVPLVPSKSLPQQPFDSSASLAGDLEKPRGRRRAPVHGLGDRRNDLIGGCPRLSRICDGSFGRGHANAVAHDDVSGADGSCGRVNPDARPRAPMALPARDRQVYRVGNDVGEIEQIERALVRDHSHFPAGGEPCGDQFLAG